MAVPDGITARGFDDVTGRQLFSLHVASTAELPTRLDLQSSHFACLLAWDASRAPTDSVTALVERLLRAGASYFACWGPDCERVEGIIDEIVAYPGSDFGVPDDSVIMTTSHDAESLEEALWFFLTSAWPDEHYVDSTRAALAISIGSIRWAQEISLALEDVRNFVRRVSTDGVA
ncbi:MAG TPA: hypothetical protein VE907_19790 [Gammaproteobacteria bacterium]|nr:hypothetical protein [Gammaproteobacteria bacterium]